VPWRRADALAPAQEAVELYRALARGNPDAFTQALASSLGMMGQVWEANDDREAALACFREGMEILTPAFAQLPEAFAPLVGQLAADYLRVLAATSRAPDLAGAEAFLLPVTAKLQRLAAGAPPACARALPGPFSVLRWQDTALPAPWFAKEAARPAGAAGSQSAGVPAQYRAGTGNLRCTPFSTSPRQPSGVGDEVTRLHLFPEKPEPPHVGSYGWRWPDTAFPNMVRREGEPVRQAGSMGQIAPKRRVDRRAAGTHGRRREFPFEVPAASTVNSRR
jgi:hypothetical protein